MDNTLHFAYGCLREANMVSWVTGRHADGIVGHPATLTDYVLGLQELAQVPDTPMTSLPNKLSLRQLLKNSWGEDFSSYTIMPEKVSIVAGTLWELSTEDILRIRDWELVDFGWFREVKVLVKIVGGQTVCATAFALGEGQEADRINDGINYEPFLYSPEKFKNVAEKARREFDKRSQLASFSATTKESEA